MTVFENYYEYYNRDSVIISKTQNNYIFIGVYINVI